MNILYVHNYYQNPGGEDQAFAAEAALLESNGHLVRRFSMHNDAVAGMNPLTLAGKLIWNGDARDDIRAIVRGSGIEVVHFHNTFPLVSPSAYYAAKSEGARVVQTLHNFRLVCPGAFLSREGRVCEECLGKAIAWRGVVHRCYRGSRLQTAAIGTMLATHRAAGTWDRQVDAYIALTGFARDKFIQGGLPADRIAVKPNFVEPDPGCGSGQGGYALFVGRLTEEKGIRTLLGAWERLGESLPLKIAGDGPLVEEVRQACASNSEIEYVGPKPRAEVLALMKDASFLVFPSVWYEGFPMTIAEAYASGLPVIASNLGSMASIVKDGVTGLHCEPGNVQDLIDKVQWLQAHPEQLRNLRRNARREFTVHYSAAGNYTQLMRIYHQGSGSPTRVHTNQMQPTEAA
jgi:glycosyltransferase involved in cell wall biosynthesis